MGNRIIIIGNGGTGKSTLAMRLSRLLNISVTHLDRLSFGKNWVRVSEREFLEKLRAVLSTEKWIVEGWSFHSTMRQRLEAAETIIYLKYPVWYCYWSAFLRHVKYTFRQNPYDPDNSWIWRKTIRMVKAMWLVHKVYEPELNTMLTELQGAKDVHVFRSRSELRKFMKVLHFRLQDNS